MKYKYVKGSQKLRNVSDTNQCKDINRSSITKYFGIYTMKYIFMYSNLDKF